MFSTRSVLYHNYPWTERVRKLAKKMYVDNGGKMDAEANYYEPWAMYGEEACRIIELEKEKLREERKILKDAAKKSKSAVSGYERLEKQEEEMSDDCCYDCGEDKTNGGWLDIASAPRDGTLIDIWVDDLQDRYTDCHFDKDTQLFVMNLECGVKRLSFSATPPTYWMPVPQPPINDKQGEEEC